MKEQDILEHFKMSFKNSTNINALPLPFSFSPSPMCISWISGLGAHYTNESFICHLISDWLKHHYTECWVRRSSASASRSRKVGGQSVGRGWFCQEVKWLTLALHAGRRQFNNKCPGNRDSSSSHIATTCLSAHKSSLGW